LSVLLIQTIFSFFSFEHVHVSRKRVVISLLMQLLFFKAPEFLLKPILVFFGRLSIQIFNECSLSSVELFGSLFGLPVKLGHIKLHLFSLFFDLLTLEFFLLEGFESNKLGDGGKFGIDKL
jgi:hypothetical protein